MPRMDGTGPTGQGPMTGRRMGPCGASGLNGLQSSSARPVNWLGRLVLGAISGFGLGTYGVRRDGGHGMGAGRGRGGRRTFR